MTARRWFHAGLAATVSPGFFVVVWSLVAWSACLVSGGVAEAQEPRAAQGRKPGAGAAPAKVARPAPDVTTEALLQRLDEARMHDVVVWVLDRIDADDSASEDLRKSSPFRRAVALVGLSRMESDSAKRGKLLDEAQKYFDGYLKSGKEGDGDGDRIVAAYTQKGNLLVERARLALDQSKRPGQDPKPLVEASVKFFDEAFAGFDSAEKAILSMLKAVGEELASLGGDGKKQDEGETKDGPAVKKRKTAAEMRRDNARIEELKEEQERLRGQLLQTRLLLASTQFEKSKAYGPSTEAWKKTIDDSTKRYAELYEKYRNRGAGLFARFYEGRNQAVMAQAAAKPEERKKLFEKAVLTLADIRTLDGQGFVPALRAKAYNTTFECWIDQKNLDGFDEVAEKVALASVPPDKLDAEWLGMKYRAAVILAQKGEAEGPKGKPRLKSAQKLAAEVAKVNRDFAKEARELLGQLGKKVSDDGATASFETAMDDIGGIVGGMQGKAGEAKELEKAGKAQEAAAAKAEAAALRDKALVAIMAAMPTASEEDLEKLNRARYLATFLLYDAKRLYEAAAMGEFLAERYPNAMGSKQAARIAMASWQQIAKEGRPEWALEARKRSADIAGAIVRIWPDDPSSADAAVVAIASATEQRDPSRIMELLDVVPADSPRRAEVLLRGGSALWREVLERRRLGDEKASAETAGGLSTEKMLARAVESIDAGLAAAAKSSTPGTVDKLAIGAALARCQIAMEAGDTEVVKSLLANPVYGPWVMVNQKDAAGKPVVDGTLAEEILRLSLRFFIQSEQLDDAQKAMDLLEASVGSGEDASERLTNTYLAMGRELQQQLAGIAGGAGGEVTSGANSRAGAILAGFEKFLDRVAGRDKKTSSQLWVATTYLALGSGPGQSDSVVSGVVPKAKRQEYLKKSADVYESLLKSGDEKIKDAEPSIRLKLATVYREVGRWDDALGHLEWIVNDPKRVNWLAAQIEAATFLSAAGEGETDRAKADAYLKQAVVGRQEAPIVFWGWGGLANKLAKQFLSAGAGDPKAAETKRLFFLSRLNVPKCRVARAERAEGAERVKQLEMAEKDIVLTHKLYPELGGPEFRVQFDKLLEQIQKQLGRAPARGLEDLEAAQGT